MRFLNAHKRVGLPALATVLVVTITACASTSKLTSIYLDPRTGNTVTSNITPILLYRDNSAYAAYARDYVQLGPIEVNRSGQFRYFLWVGVWSTVQDPDSTNQRGGFDTVTVFADGEPLNLQLSGWTPNAIGASKAVYLKPVASAADAYYEVTIDQIRLLAEAQSIRLLTTATPSKEYHLWSNQERARQELVAFLRAALL